MNGIGVCTSPVGEGTVDNRQQQRIGEKTYCLRERFCLEDEDDDNEGHLADVVN